ncbi:hypothetical protein Tco_1461775 [Tanacetum coccineum]
MFFSPPPPPPSATYTTTIIRVCDGQMLGHWICGGRIMSTIPPAATTTINHRRHHQAFTPPSLLRTASTTYPTYYRYKSPTLPTIATNHQPQPQLPTHPPPSTIDGSGGWGLVVVVVVGGGIGVWVGLVVVTMVGGDGELVVCGSGGFRRWRVRLVVEAVLCWDSGGHAWRRGQ